MGWISDTIGKVVDFGKKAAPYVINPIGALAGDVASKYLTSKYVGQPNADAAYAQSKEAAAVAYQRAQEMYKNRYKWTMQDMRSAGINPIMAASGGFSVGSAPNIASAQAFKADYPHDVGSSSALNFAQIGKAKAEEKNVEQDTLLKIQQTKNEIKKILETRARTKQIDTDERRIAQEVINSEQRLYLMGRQISKIDAEIREIEQRQDLEHSQMEVQNQKIEEVRALKKKYAAEAASIMAKLPELVKRSGMYKGVIGSINGAIKETFSMLRIVPVIGAR